MKTFTSWLACLACLFCLRAQAQVESPPTLSVGLNKLVFEKGVIDVQLLTEIIADKQDEIKKEFVKRAILGQLEGKTNFAFYNYALNVTNILLNEKNKKVMTREIMEYTANLALVYGFTELYLQVATRTQNAQLEGIVNIRNLPENVTILLNTAPFKEKCACGGESITWSDIMLDMVFDVAKNNYEIQQKGFFVQALNISEDFYTEVNSYQRIVKKCEGSKEAIALKKLRADINGILNVFFQYYDVLKETDFLKGATLKEITDKYKEIVSERKNALESNIKEDRAELSSLQDKLKNEINSESIARTNASSYLDDIKSFISQKSKIPQDVKGIINVLSIDGSEESITNAINKLEKINEMANQTIADTSRREREDYERAKELSELQEKIKNINKIRTFRDNLKNYESKITALNSKIKEFETNINKKIDENLTYSDARAYLNYNIKKIKNALMEKVDKRLDAADKKVIEEVMQAMVTLENPNRKYENILFANYLLDSLSVKLTSLNFKYGTFKGSVEALHLIASQIKANVFERFAPEFERLKGIAFLNPKQFIEFITQLNELDKSKTYDYLFKVITDVGNVLPDGKSGEVFNSIVNNVKKYTEFNHQTDAVKIDVESIILDFYERYASRQNKPIELYFNIGANQAFADKYNGVTINGETIYNLAFAGEKIGVKFKIIDWNRRHNFKKNDAISGALFNKTIANTYARNRKPFISDFHFLFYGSGLLYNLANTKTNSNFNGTLLGGSLGLSFFNGLDFNAGVLYPFIANNSSIMYNIGCDIKITEYLEKLMKKRRRQNTP